MVRMNRVQSEIDKKLIYLYGDLFRCDDDVIKTGDLYRYRKTLRTKRKGNKRETIREFDTYEEFYQYVRGAFEYQNNWVLNEIKKQ